MQPVSKRRLVALGSLVALLVAIVGTWSFVHRMPSLSLTNVKSISIASTSSSLYGDRVLAAYAGQLIAFAPQTGVSTTLTGGQANIGIDQLDSLSTSQSNRYILFHTNLVPQSTALAAVLAAKNYATDSDYWWVFDTTTKTYTPLPAGTLLAKFNGDNVIGISSSSPGETLTRYTAQAVALNQLSINSAADFYPVLGGYILQTTQGSLLFTADGVVNRKIGDSNRLIGTTSDGRYALLSQGQGGNQALVQLGLEDNSLKTIATGLNGQFAWLPSGFVLYSTTGGELQSYSLTTHKTVNWKASNKTNLQPTMLVNDHTAIVSAGDKHFIVSTTTLSDKL